MLINKYITGLYILHTVWTRLCILPAEDISAEDAANDVAQVRDVVDIRQGTGHKEVSFALLWQTERAKKADLGFNPPVSEFLTSCVLPQGHISRL